MKTYLAETPSVLVEGAENVQNLFMNIVEDPVNRLLLPVGEVILLVLLAYLSVRLIGRLIDKLFSLSKIESNQANTLRKLIQSITTYTIYFIAILTILAKFGFNLGPILAGAGILGLAIGFGAQSLVKDVITGFFLIFERQLEVGDIVQVNQEISGTVEEVGLRVTKIREYNQRLHYLANGQILQVTNYNREKMKAIVPITVPYEADLEIVHHALEEVCQVINERFKEHLVETPEVVGITRIDQNGVEFTITALSEPGEYWELERQMRKEAVLILHRYDIQIAYPRSIIYSPDQITIPAHKNRNLLETAKREKTRI